MLKKPIQEHAILELLKTHYGIDAQAADLISGGADINAFVYKAETKSNAYFVKLKYNVRDDVSLSIISLLHNSGITEIIPPISTVDGKLFQQIERLRIIVYPFIHAPNGFSQNLSENQWKQLGNTLRNIHNTSLPPSLLAQIKKETYSSKWREMARSLYSKIKPNTSDDKIKTDFKSFFKENFDTIHRLVDSAEDLSQKISFDLNQYVLCHSDIHAGNILIDTESIYIIDWDDPIWAPKERDLMFIGGGVGNVWNKPDEIQYFYEGYGKTEIDNTLISYYRHERIVEDIALFGQDLLSQDESDQSRLEMFQHFKGMFYPNGVAEITLLERNQLLR